MFVGAVVTGSVFTAGGSSPSAVDSGVVTSIRGDGRLRSGSGSIPQSSRLPPGSLGIWEI